MSSILLSRTFNDETLNCNQRDIRCDLVVIARIQFNELVSPIHDELHIQVQALFFKVNVNYLSYHHSEVDFHLLGLILQRSANYTRQHIIKSCAKCSTGRIYYNLAAEKCFHPYLFPGNSIQILIKKVSTELFSCLLRLSFRSQKFFHDILGCLPLERFVIIVR